MVWFQGFGGAGETVENMEPFPPTLASRFRGVGLSSFCSLLPSSSSPPLLLAVPLTVPSSSSSSLLLLLSSHYKPSWFLSTT